MPTSTIPRPLRVFLLGNAAATAVCLLAELFCWRLGLPETYCNPFFVGIRFFDFDSFQQRFHHLHTLKFYSLATPFSYSYPAPAAILYAAFYRFGTEASLNLFLAFFCAGILLCASLFTRALIRSGLAVRPAIAFTAAALAFAYPVWFCFQRANMEIVVFFLLAAGFRALARGRRLAAAVLFGLAASLKIVPALYLALFDRARQYRYAAVAVAVAALATFIGLLFLGPTLVQAWRGVNSGIQQFHDEFMVMHPNPNSLGFDHTPIGFYRRIFGLTPGFVLMLKRYTWSAAFAGTVLYFARIRRMPFLNQLLCLSIAAIWLPPISFEYTLIHLYLGVAFLALASLNPVPQAPSLTPHFVLLALLCAPLSEFILHGTRFGGQIKCVLLGALFVLSVVRRIPSRFDPLLPSTTT